MCDWEVERFLKSTKISCKYFDILLTVHLNIFILILTNLTFYFFFRQLGLLPFTLMFTKIGISFCFFNSAGFVIPDGCIINIKLVNIKINCKCLLHDYRVTNGYLTLECCIHICLQLSSSEHGIIFTYQFQTFSFILSLFLIHECRQP